MQKFKLVIIILLLPLFTTAQQHTPQVTVGTNLLGYANFITLNAEVSISITDRWNILIAGKYNPFTFNNGTSQQIQNRVLSGNIGIRYWSWHINSGWFFGAKGIYGIYNQGGIISPQTEEGNSIALGVNAGYSLMISKHFNIEFAAGFAFGTRRYRHYEKPSLGRITEQGTKFYIAPDNLSIQLVYLF